MKTLIIFWLFPLTLFSQTRISVGSVIEFVQLRSNSSVPSIREIEIIEKKMKPYYGLDLKIERPIGNKLFLSTNFQFTKLRPKAFINDISGYYNKLNIDYYKINFSGNYAWKKWIYLGIGGNCNLLTNLRYLRGQKSSQLITNLQREYGLTATTGVRWRRIGFNLNFYQGLSQTYDRIGDFNFFPIQSINGTFYYQFIFNSKTK